MKIEINMAALIRYFIALVWLVNGFWCKILGMVPRHRQIVGRILGEENAHTITIWIGVGEVFMAIWILSNYKARLNTWVQITTIATMNILEFYLVPDLLLWGRLNALFALIFIGLIYYNDKFQLKKRISLL